MSDDVHPRGSALRGIVPPEQSPITGENGKAVSSLSDQAAFHTTSVPQKVRIAWIDYAKGIGIFLVVLGHALRGLVPAGIMLETPLSRMVDTFIYSFHMPLFFFVSGLFLSRQVQRSARSFLLDKVGTLVYPYLLWSTLQGLMQSAASHYTNRAYSLADIWQISYAPVMQFWFLYALFLILLLYLALAKARLGPWAIFAVFAAWGLAGERLHLIEWTPLQHAQAYGAYVALGAALYSNPRIARLPDQLPTAVAALIVLTGYGLIAFAVITGQQLLLQTPALLAACGMAASIALATLIARPGSFKLVEQWGKLSLEIYVAHTIASAALRIILANVLNISNVPTHIVVGTLGGVYLPIALALLAARFGADYIYRLRLTRPAEGRNEGPLTRGATPPPGVSQG